MRFLKIRLPEPDRAFELYRNPNGRLVVTVHGNGEIHINIEDWKTTVIAPDGEDLILCEAKPKKDPCPACGGRGYFCHVNTSTNCSMCNGTGKIDKANDPEL